MRVQISRDVRGKDLTRSSGLDIRRAVLLN
jgi:hypothetical protein